MCKEVDTGEILALKVLKKKNLIEDDDCDLVFTENNVLRKIKHPFVTVSKSDTVCMHARKLCCHLEN